MEGPFQTKASARIAIRALGYTEFYSHSESGDHGPGSREYYSKPNSPKNQFDVPIQQASLSKVGRVWYVSEFGVDAAS